MNGVGGLGQISPFIGEKEVARRDGTTATSGREIKVGKPKTATNLVNGVWQSGGSIKSLSPKQVADLLGHSTSQITEMYYVRKDSERLSGVTDEFNL